MCEKEGAGGRGGSSAGSSPPTPFHHPILFSSPISIVLGANWELAGGKWSGRTDGQRMGRREGVRMNGAERREAVGQCHTCKLCLLFTTTSSIQLSFISFHRDSGPNSIREEEGESLAVMIGSESDRGRAMPCPIFRDKRAQLFPSICARATRAENN